MDKLPHTHTDNDKTLLVGTSTVKDIHEEKLVRTTVKSVSGGVISGIREAVNGVTGPYDRVILIGVGNDCDNDDDVDVENIMKQLKLLIRDAKRISKHITVGASYPRNKGAQTTDTIDSFNAGLIVICEEEGCTIANNDDTFKLRDGQSHDAYLLSDGVHLTYEGTN